jgi:hypothetical protein
MSDKEPVVDLHEVEDYHNLIEVDAIEDVPISMGSFKKKKKSLKSVERHRMYGTILIPFLVSVQMTTSRGPNASIVMLHTWF